MLYSQMSWYIIEPAALTSYEHLVTSLNNKYNDCILGSVGTYGTGNGTGNPVHLFNPNHYPTCVLTNPNFRCRVFQLTYGIPYYAQYEFTQSRAATNVGFINLDIRMSYQTNIWKIGTTSQCVPLRLKGMHCEAMYVPAETPCRGRRFSGLRRRQDTAANFAVYWCFCWESEK